MRKEIRFSFDEHFQYLMKEKQLDTVVILGHMNPDGDACGSVMGLAHYIRSAYPEYRVIPYLSEKLDKGPKAYAMKDPVFDPFQKPAAVRYLTVICDTATKARIIGEEYFLQAEAVIVLDHHASNEGYGDVNFTHISEACAENVYHILDRGRLVKAAKAPHPNAADYLYLGIIHDTGCFDRANAVLLEAAADLIRFGVDHRTILLTRKSQTLVDVEKESWLMSHARRGHQDEIAYVFVNRKTAEEVGIKYEHIHPIAEKLRDCADIQMAFSMFEESEDCWRCSFRSDGVYINVNKLMNPFGGGGHAGAAGLRLKTEDPEGLLKQILDAVDQVVENK